MPLRAVESGLPRALARVIAAVLVCRWPGAFALAAPLFSIPIPTSPAHPWALAA
jgi:hypothetical protein